MPGEIAVDELVERATAGQPRAVARLISLVEHESPRLREVAAALAPHTGRARVLGLTGPPGVGKSTTTSALIGQFRGRGERVGVLAIDPSSPFSGGALLGDRIRMQEHATDSGVFIRSMATRGQLGGLAWATPQAVRVLDAAGYQVVLIETVGIGQSEVDIVSLADTTLVLLAPGMGDGVQAVKAGVLEVADVFGVNKADREGAGQTVRDLRHLVALSRRERPADWRQPVVPLSATIGDGVDKLLSALDEHHGWLVEHGELLRRRTRRAAEEIEAIAVRELRARIGNPRCGARLAGLAEQVLAGELDPYTAADRLLATG